MHHLAPLPGLEYQVFGVTLHLAFRHDALLRPAAIAGAGSSFILKPVVNTSPTADSLAQRGLDLLAAGDAGEAAQAFRAAVAADPRHIEAVHGLVRALRDAGKLNESVAAAEALTRLAPDDPLAHTALSISLQHAGQIPEAEAAAGRARILEWKAQLQTPPLQEPQ
jgi:tetratricopeptide (TPR) repeat protein